MSLRFAEEKNNQLKLIPNSELNLFIELHHCRSCNRNYRIKNMVRNFRKYSTLYRNNAIGNFRSCDVIIHRGRRFSLWLFFSRLLIISIETWSVCKNIQFSKTSNKASYHNGALTTTESQQNLLFRIRVASSIYTVLGIYMTPLCIRYALYVTGCQRVSWISKRFYVLLRSIWRIRATKCVHVQYCVYFVLYRLLTCVCVWRVYPMVPYIP